MKSLAVVTVVATLLFASGCSKRTDALGAGPDIDACVAASIYDGYFTEPSAKKPEELLLFADAGVRLIDRIRADYKIEVKDKDDFVPDKSVMDAWHSMAASLKAFRDRVTAAGDDPAKLRVAANSLAADDAFLKADSTVIDFLINQCPHGS